MDWATLSRIMYKDILGERRLANVIQQMSPEEVQQMIQQQQEMASKAAEKKPGPRGSDGGA